MPLIATRGAASAQGFGELAQSGPFNYIDDVFSTWLYTGTGATQSINNGIDLSGKGGMLWIKCRNVNSGHSLFDTARGASSYLVSNTTAAAATSSDMVTSFNSNGFTLGNDQTLGRVNFSSARTYTSWTFREQLKFFDVVTYTGNDVYGRAISHNLGAEPGFMIVKCTSSASASWMVYHRETGGAYPLVLNSSNGAFLSNIWSNQNPTSTQFFVGDNFNVNGPSETYVAYLFAHNAGGFGATGTDNVISCGSYTGNGSATGPTINLGYEPQWVMVKRAYAAGNWLMFDVMRGMSNTASQYLSADEASAEFSWGGASVVPTATGFRIASSSTAINESGADFIYVAIRRPMKPPTTGTSVFSPNASSASAGTSITTNFPVDLQAFFYRPGSDTGNTTFVDRLRGMGANSSDASGNKLLRTSNTDAETTSGSVVGYEFWNTGWKIGNYYGGASNVFYSFRRAPGFFDTVCYTGNNVSGRTINHNLGVAPELMIVKQRSGTSNWSVYAAPRGATEVSYLNNTFEFFGDAGAWANTAPTSSVFTVGAGGDTNNGGSTFVAYLFASQAGVSKVGSYTGTGGTQTINCGFTGGARFVLIKRTDARFYSWFVWDTARGMVAGTDPRLALNTTDAEVNNNWVYTATTGFQLVTNDAQVNANGGSYIYLAIA